jgi:hypothetical protein
MKLVTSVCWSSDPGNCQWWVTRFKQSHVHMYMFCPYVISTLHHLLEELQMRTFKKYISHAILLTTLHLKEIN